MPFRCQPRCKITESAQLTWPWAQAVPSSIGPDRDFDVPNLPGQPSRYKTFPNRTGGNDRSFISSRIAVLHLYSIKTGLGVSHWKQESFKSLETNAVDPMFCIFNLRSISQAGRGGFDSRLPLHPVNQLRGPFQGPESNRAHEAPIAFSGAFTASLRRLSDVIV